MAGIGFALKRLSENDNLASQSLAAGHAIIVTSGPWVIIMAGLALITGLGTPILGAEQTTIFRILVIYSFALSLIVTVPIALETTLRISALLFERRFTEVQAVYFGALVITAAVALVAGWLVFGALLRLPHILFLAALFCGVQVSLLWLAMSLVAAIRQYTMVTLAFAIGLSVSVALGLALARLGHGTPGLLMGFGAGLCLSFCILNALIIRTFPGHLATIEAVLAGLRHARLRSMTFLLAGLASAVAVWIDKLVVWQSGEALVVGSGLIHAPRYDVPMFIAYLSVVPVMSAVAIWLETGFFDNYRLYRNIVRAGGTFRHIETQRIELAHGTIRTIFSAFVVQLAVSIALAIASPLIVSLLNLDFETLPVLRLALVGAAFHFLFLACCGVILFVQHGPAYLWLQGVFVVLNGALTAAMLFNPDLLGLGYVFAAALSALVAYAVMLRTLGALNRLTFIDNNPSVAA